MEHGPTVVGGTWLGINRQGHIGLLTNIYSGKSSPGAGRGFIVIDYLNDPKAEEYLNDLALSKVTYSPFNLMLFEPKG